jgi:hypothetical protein
LGLSAHHHPRRRRVQLFTKMREFDIIRAEGAWGCRFVEGKTELADGSGAMEFIAEVLEVFGADFELQNFLDHRREVH